MPERTQFYYNVNEDGTLFLVGSNEGVTIGVRPDDGQLDELFVSWADVSELRIGLTRLEMYWDPKPIDLHPYQAEQSA